MFPHISTKFNDDLNLLQTLGFILFLLLLIPDVKFYLLLLLKKAIKNESS